MTTDLEPLRTIVARLAALSELEKERDDLIRAQIAAGTKVVDRVEATGLSRPRIYQIRDGRR
ncbi:hypothetical protein [Psychromicrobium xiongbiense]|uniref:hypothetical protein n=1 Tax=Psychromicrobium xiongbiense TaxID=3051184 RepID=UPI002557C717|nr:hypothetical protein [Psychromicrobium sp. YIM S02556]